MAATSAAPRSPTSPPSRRASRPPGHPATTPSSAPRCRSSARRSPKRCDLRGGQRVLDVAAGNGNATLAAARRWCAVTSTDYVAACSTAARERAAAERLDIDFQDADAEALPFADAQLRRRALDLRRDVRAQPRAQRRRDAARVPPGRPHRPGQLDARQLHRPAVQDASASTCRRRPASQSPALWGSRAAPEEAVRRRGRVDRGDAAPLQLPLPLVGSTALDIFRTYYGPVHKAFGALPAEKAAALERDMIELFDAANRGGAGSFVAPSEYVEVVVTRR